MRFGWSASARVAIGIVVGLAALAAGVPGGVWITEARGAPPVTIETVIVGNPGNAGDPIQFQDTFGSVDYVYAIGKYEVTAGQYAAFLNAVAATDPYGLYNLNMWTHADGCRIERTGSPGSHAYSVAPEWATRPVNFVSWGDAARFANWLHNGQPTGAPDLATTEDGSYFLNGMITDEELEDIVREPGATWVIPTEHEWYKAAYHKNDGVTGNYWNYPTAAMNGVSNDLIDPDPGNNATFRDLTGDFTIGPPYNRTEAGAHENSASAYGTFDQGGNVTEFNETVPWTDIRGIRGGSWFSGDIMGKWDRPLDMHSSDEFRDLGFRTSLARTAVTNLRGVDPVATSFEWDPMPGDGVTLYDLVRGDLANLAGDAGAVHLGPLTCIENDSLDASSQSHPDPDMPAPDTAFFYLVRFQSGLVIGPWGLGSEGQIRAGTGSCSPWRQRCEPRRKDGVGGYVRKEFEPLRPWSLPRALFAPSASAGRSLTGIVETDCVAPASGKSMRMCRGKPAAPVTHAGVGFPRGAQPRRPHEHSFRD